MVGTILLPPQSAQVEHEAELVVVMGKRGRNITAEQAKRHIFGYTIGNDVTARDLQKADNQWTRAKGFDTFCSFGPWIDTEFDPPTRWSPAGSTGRCARWPPPATWSSTLAH
jgi:2-keto-4-pentenoate hydratase/2-oxohepta-3-ene-1,7-dioic acid hydratase in catechol pathway